MTRAYPIEYQFNITTERGEPLETLRGVTEIRAPASLPPGLLVHLPATVYSRGQTVELELLIPGDGLDDDVESIGPIVETVPLKGDVSEIEIERDEHWRIVAARRRDYSAGSGPSGPTRVVFGQPVARPVAAA